MVSLEGSLLQIAVWVPRMRRHALYTVDLSLAGERSGYLNRLREAGPTSCLSFLLPPPFLHSCLPSFLSVVFSPLFSLTV